MASFWRPGTGARKRKYSGPPFSPVCLTCSILDVSSLGVPLGLMASTLLCTQQKTSQLECFAK